MKNAFVDPTTGALKCWGYVNENDPGDVLIPVEETFDKSPGAWRWTGTEWVSWQAPSKTPRAFRQALLGQLDGADRTAKLARAQDRREKYPGLTEPFLTAIAGDKLSQDEADFVLSLWARIKGFVGTPQEVLSDAEIRRIEDVAGAYGISLN